MDINLSETACKFSSKAVGSFVKNCIFIGQKLQVNLFLYSCCNWISQKLHAVFCRKPHVNLYEGSCVHQIFQNVDLSKAACIFDQRCIWPCQKIHVDLSKASF